MMRLPSLVRSLPFLGVSLCLSVSVLPVRAQEDTARHRAAYDEINKTADGLKKVSTIWQEKDDPLQFALTGWFDGAALKKIVAAAGEDGDGVEEFYLEDGKPLFVFRRYQQADPDAAGKMVTVEDRFYFNGGKLFKWIGADKKAVAPGSGDFKSEAERLTSNCANFVKALKSKAGSAKPDKAAAATQTSEGVFLGIEEGDYFHWRLKTAKGTEISFFILKGDKSVDAALAAPKKYIGKKCRVTWKKSMEEIPEEGGKIEVEHILSVEWLK